MSGGFFRGTSADQDTRFSNKMKKLLKSQKFAQELDTVIDPSKIQMDVVKPWIATRVTELLGFEDEVLINFIYGLLEGKNVDGKHVQIQLTGFMEKNTGRFMKELWGLLISAQSNLSGIPQQFLDIKAEETRLKKVESERIATELQRKKDQEKEVEEERQRERDAAAEAARIARGAKGFADNDLDSKSSDERKAGRGPGASRRSLSRDRSPAGRSYRRNQRSRRSSDSSLSRSPVRSPPRRRAFSRSVSRSPRRRRRSPIPDRSVRPTRPVRSPARRNYSPRHSRSPIRRRKSPPAYRSPPRRRYPSRSPPSRRSSSYSLSPVPRSHARSPYRRNRSPSRDPPIVRNGFDGRREAVYRSPDRVDRSGKSGRQISLSPNRHDSPSPSPKPSLASRQPTVNMSGERQNNSDVEEKRTAVDRGRKMNVGDKPSSNDVDMRNSGTVDRAGRDAGRDKRLYSDIEERKTGFERGAKDKGGKWVHSELDEMETEASRPGTDLAGEKRPYSEPERKTGADRGGRIGAGEKRLYDDTDPGRAGLDRGGRSAGGEKRPYRDLDERKSGFGKEQRQFSNMDERKSGFEREKRNYSDIYDRRTEMNREKRQYGDTDERKTGFDRRDRPVQRERSPAPESRQVFKEPRDTRRNNEHSRSPVEASRRMPPVRPPVTSDNDDSDTQKESLPKKSRIQENDEVQAVRDDDHGSLSPRTSEERHKEEKRRRKEEKRQRREERHKRKREEKQKRKEEKRAMKTGSKPATMNGEDKRHSPREEDESDDERPDQKQIEDALRQRALESLQAKKAISH